MASDESFISEIQQIMYSFGDCSKPLLVSVKLISDVVLNEIIKIIYQLEEVCVLRESKMVGIEEILFLYRKNYKKLKQVIEFLRFKDLKAQCMKGTNGATGGKDGIKMDDDDIMGSTAGIAKFKNWILPHCCETQVELSSQTWNILAYFARDMVGELVECSLAVRKGFEKSSHRKLRKKHRRYKQQLQKQLLANNTPHSGQLLQSEYIAQGSTSELPTSLVSPSFGPSLESKQNYLTANADTDFSVGADLKHYQAITVSEIREAIRRLCLLNQPLTWNLVG
ncbi:hypothetical protein HELRODRAFT_174915 [Helobdella robusta]|uniref:Uncharacterized protein n=1 Tax=Helobdella robusta TaxID=6412 RepID=T1F8M0_HELRO|nr:hypothetical protein HELRODRAFT_174915 [Helobdella robusta]ESO01360.1 hypothetical protein HELRODRAFT_174915 [Helobdella robusta]